MQSDLLLGDQMYHLTLSKVEIPHSENEDVEHYTTYPKRPEKTGGDPVVHARNQGNPLQGHVILGHVYQHFVLLI